MDFVFQDAIKDCLESGEAFDKDMLDTLATVPFIKAIRLNNIECRTWNKVVQESLFERVFRLEKLCHLAFFCAGLNNKGVRKIVSLLLDSRNTSIKRLDLSFNHIGEDGGYAIARLLERTKSLVWLDLNQCSIPHYGVQAIAWALRRNSTLTMLRMLGNHAGSQGGASIGEMLYVNTTLNELQCQASEIDDKAAPALHAGLRVNTTLKVLLMDRNDISEDHICTIFEDINKKELSSNRKAGL